MPSYAFTVVLDASPTEAALDTFAGYTVHDAAFAAERGVTIVRFDRHSTSLAEAIASAVHDLDLAGMTAVRVEDDDLVTLADIADRVDQSRESIRRYSIGERGPGGFPPTNQPHP